MRSDMLYGIRFSKNESWKDELIEAHEAYIRQLHQQSVQGAEKKVIEFAKLLGISPEDAKTTLDRVIPNRYQYNPDQTDIRHFLSEKECKHYYITESVLTMCKKIRVKEPYDLEWLNTLQDGKKQLNFGKHFIRYSKKGDQITGLMGTESPNDKVAGVYSYFSLPLRSSAAEGSGPHDDYDEHDQSKNISLSYDSQSSKLFYQLLTFMELAEVQELYVPAGAKTGAKKSEFNLKNDTSFGITVVNTNWNKIIRTEGFSVDGHLRKQPYGPGRKLRKLIWIDPFHKNGYNLNAQKINVERQRGLKP